MLEKLPGVAITAGATMCALWWLTSRRNEVREHEAREKYAKQAAKKASAKDNGTSHEENGHG